MNMKVFNLEIMIILVEYEVQIIRGVYKEYYRGVRVLFSIQ